MTTTYRSFAKINLHLQVVGRRPDGYHELVTVFQTVDLHDLVEVTARTHGVTCEVADGDAPSGSANLAARAARLFSERFGGGGAGIRLWKRIPAGGGMGGGSSNAACVLRALNEGSGRLASSQELHALGAQLGADVPFFLTGGTCLGTGRGDRIRELPEPEGRGIVLAIPPIRISTAEVFGALAAPPSTELTPSVALALDSPRGMAIEALGGQNDLEPVVLERYPPVRAVYNGLRKAGAGVVRVSGSGSTVFACFANGVPASLDSCLPEGTRLVEARTLTRSEAERTRRVQL